MTPHPAGCAGTPLFNLGYTEEVAREFPYVAELSGGPSTWLWTG